jgi:hypothetical protein
MASSVNLSDELYQALEQALRTTKNGQKFLYTAVANAPFEYGTEMALLFLGFITFFVVDPKSKLVLAASATDNDYYKQAVSGYDFSLGDYKVALSAKDNSAVQAIISGKPISSDNWDSFRRPKIEEGIARLNQASSGIGYSVVYPLTGKTQGALMYNFYQFPEAVGEAHEQFMQRYTDIVSTVLN